MSFKSKLALEASAGSGKTFSLSIRYISLLFQGSNPKDIIALTFTKKAAAEMKDRVFNTLQDLESRKNELEELAKILQLSNDEILNKKNQIMTSFLESNIKIMTIDSFLGLVLRKFSLHFGIMPDFTTNETSTIMHVQEEFIKNSKSKKAYDSFLFFANIGKKSLNDFFGYFEQMYEKNSELDGISYSRVKYPNQKNILKITQDIKEYLVSKDASNTAVSQFEVDNADDLLKKGFIKKESLDYRTFSKVYTPKLDEMFGHLKNELKIFYAHKERFWLGELFYLYEIYKFSKYKEIRKRNKLTFNDVTNIVYLLLHKYIDKEFLYFRLDANIDHLLIDEFQDTSIVQFKILKPLIEEIISGEGVKKFKSFFYVGDTKQSIYRFRGGAKALFSYVAKIFNVEVDSLSYNYRSSKEIVDFVNNTFGDKILNYEQQIPTQNSGYVEILTCENILNDLKDRLKILFEKNIKQEDIAILCVTNKDAETVRLFLQEAFDDLQINTENTKNIIYSPNVAVIVEFLKYFYFKDNLFGQNFEALRGCDFDKLPDVSNFLNTEKPLEIAIKCISMFNIDAHDIDVLRFLELLSDYADLESLLFGLDKISLKSIRQDLNGIKLLTIHKSKGLEFSTVLVIDRIGNKNNSSDFLMFEYDDIKLIKIHLNVANREFFDSEYKIAKEKEQILKYEDVVNQQYVAFTRAQNNLFILKKDKGSYFENLNLTFFKSGDIRAEEKILNQQSNYDVIFQGIYFGRQNISKKYDTIEGDILNVYFGIALHYTLEMMVSFTQEDLKNAIMLAKNKYGSLLEEQSFFSIQQRVLKLIEHHFFKKIIKSGNICKEQSFIYNEKRGQIDLLIEGKNRVFVLDYKTSPYQKDLHVKQVSEYKEAIFNITKKNTTAIICYMHETSVDFTIV